MDLLNEYVLNKVKKNIIYSSKQLEGLCLHGIVEKQRNTKYICGMDSHCVKCTEEILNKHSVTDIIKILINNSDNLIPKISCALIGYYYNCKNRSRNTCANCPHKQKLMKELKMLIKKD